MCKDEMDRVMEILDSGRAGYAYLYPGDGGDRQEFLIAWTPENIANLLGSPEYNAEKTVLTDMCGRLVLNTWGRAINHCPDYKLRCQVISFLVPIQAGEREAGKILMIDRSIAEAFLDGKEIQAI